MLRECANTETACCKTKPCIARGFVLESLFGSIGELQSLTQLIVSDTAFRVGAVEKLNVLFPNLARRRGLKGGEIARIATNYVGRFPGRALQRIRSLIQYLGAIH